MMVQLKWWSENWAKKPVNCVKYPVFNWSDKSLDLICKNLKKLSNVMCKNYPQDRKTGVDALHEKLPTEGLYHEEM